MPRPADLPDFENPPLDEVVLGVQFAPVPGFRTVHVREVWDLYRAEFPKVQDQPPLLPAFETFGGVPPQQSGFQPLFMGTNSGIARVWFVSEKENHLVQFQPDRLLANWRRTPHDQPYPRFETILAAYDLNLDHLASLFLDHFDHSIQINQAEISYINIIPVETFSEAENFFKVWKSVSQEFEGLNLTLVEVIHDPDSRPYARLIQEIQSAYSPDGKHKAYKLNLTFRGKPVGSSKDDAMKFLTQGREIIVRRFANLTTTSAHKLWGVKG
jgi:uncharacterized protein (TIGR04255 family)